MAPFPDRVWTENRHFLLAPTGGPRPSPGLDGALRLGSVPAQEVTGGARHMSDTLETVHHLTKNQAGTIQ